MFPRRATFPLWQRLTALASAGLVVLVATLAASPTLHAALHRGADPTAHSPGCPHHSAPDHSPRSGLPEDGDELCLITQFAGGQAEPGVAPLLLATSLATAADVGLPPSDLRSRSTLVDRLPPGCGPP